MIMMIKKDIASKKIYYKIYLNIQSMSLRSK